MLASNSPGDPAITDPRPRLAVLVDADNVSAGFVARALHDTMRLGRITLCRLYGNLPHKVRPNWRAAAAQVPGLPAPKFVHRTGANAADFELSFDAISLQSADLDGICIMSCDGHLVHAVRRLRASGLTVHVFGRPHTARTLRRAANSFHPIANPPSA